MAGVPSPWWEKGSISDIRFPFQRQRLRRRQCSCALSATRCSSSDETGPAPVSCTVTPGTAGRQPCHWEPGLFGSQHGIPLPEDACTCAPPASARLDGPALLAMHQLGPCGGALPVAVPHPCSCSKPWVLSGTCCALPRACPGPLAWVSDGRAVLPTRGPAFASWVGQNNLRALSLPFPALCCK